MSFGVSHARWEAAPPPAQADAVVIGGGIAGTCTAFYLAGAGLSVALCEKGRIAGEQSSRNWGFVRQQGRDPREVPAIMKSLALWRGLEAEVEADLGWSEAGVLYLADSDEAMAGYDDWLSTAREHGIDSRVLSASEVGNHLGLNEHPWKAALATPSDGRAEPFKAVPAIAEAFERRGGTVLTGCAVRGIESGGGRVLGVVTERGAIKTGQVVCAAGAWSSLFNANAGLRLPQLKIRGSVGRTGPLPAFAESALWSSEFALRRRQDGGYNIAHGEAIDFDLVPDAFRFLWPFRGSARMNAGALNWHLGERFWTELSTPRRWRLDQESPFEAARVLDPAPNAALLDRALESARQRFPALAGAQFVQRWGGLIDVTPDAIPVLGQVETLQGYYIATGLSGHGFGIGPGVGELMAELILDGKPTCDLTPFRYGRFFDGTDLTPRDPL